MKSFSERNPVIIAAIGVGVVAAAVTGSLQYKKLPFFDSSAQYSAYFAEASGLPAGAAVQVAGFKVGEVSSVKLDGPKVLVTFDVRRDVRLGDRTEAMVKTKSLLGAKVLEVVPRGKNALTAPIPLDRTIPAYQLPDALGDLTAAVSGLDTDAVSTALETLAETFRDTPPDLQIAVSGVARFSKTLNERDQQLRDLLANANKAATVLGERSQQVVGLIADTDALLVALQDQGAGLDHLGVNISGLANQVSAVVNDNHEQLRPMLDKLNGALTIIDNRKEQIQKSVKMLNVYALSLGESVSSGPFFKAYVANLLPGQFVQPFVEAAFSDLGLDPNVLLPSQRTDPQIGQPGTPALPVPYPRTGQGGAPNLTLPEAITGNPADPRYPYREPAAAPPPGGPPPGPPAESPAGAVPTPAPADLPGPAEASPPMGGGQ
ncbi:MCE family protein [Mycolicibacterium holsaticum]|uniref:MCE family protein n=1 Tax=Mycolicibacterium holsaticum TaxID=152142 RepID=UPI001C7D043B|nr:MCE family protein [Mycolicibacterium holsaticum]MDA4105758.1 mammalian cell entry protein [Mycolicibacterium holsaticum DSM 44478 = JCM 12374]QZA13875.1 MCE family protein [Mycolicibacterium holsaticum DSM 44478 = JCM 12374]UNC08665.1 MCE family protein [Mycolicibacterium holsaticum DSM 44478 = JCM 12374]